MFRLFFFTTIFCLQAMAGLHVVTTTPDLAGLVEIVAAGKSDVISLTKGTQDPHQIEAKPSFMVKMRNADLVISQGLELESAWLNSLITGARNPKINSSTPGNLELGPLLEPIEIPKGDVSRAQGDVHPGGNPHFQIDPVRMGNAAMLIAQRMSELDHENAKLYTENSKNFQAKMAVKTKEWQKRLDKTGIKQVVTYHKTLSYFLDRFGIKGVMELEPKPGIPPTASHLLDVIATIKKDNIKLVLIENYFEDSVGEKLKKDIPDLTVVRVPASVGGSPEIKSTEDLIENLVKVFEAAKK